jgi:hypothetical protein
MTAGIHRCTTGGGSKHAARSCSDEAECGRGCKHGGIRIHLVPIPAGRDHNIALFKAHAHSENPHPSTSRLSLRRSWCSTRYKYLIFKSFYTMASPTAQPPISSEPIAATPTPTTTKPSQHNAHPEKLKGLQLAILLGSLTLVTFLALLDTSIVGTVTTPHLFFRPIPISNINTGYTRHNH